MTRTLVHDAGVVVQADTGQPTRKWGGTHGMVIAGRSYIDGADQTAADMEAKWGCGRLRLLVTPELREKFDRQRYLFNQAVWHGQDLEQVKREANRMATAWLALDKAAVAAGFEPIDPNVWEVTMADGSVAAIVPDGHHADRVRPDGRRMAVYTFEEISRLLGASKSVSEAKAYFPGSEVVAVRRTVSDPLDSFTDSDRGLDDPVDDLFRE